MQSTPYNQKYGMQTIYGVPKPAYRAMQLISQQPTTGVPVMASLTTSAEVVKHGGSGSATAGTIDAIVGITRADGALTQAVALLTNFNLIGGGWNLTISTELVTLEFMVPTGRPAPTTATLVRIDSTHAYAKPVWEAAKKPVYPSPLEVAQEMAASELVQEQVPLTSVAGGVALTIEMEPYSVSSIYLVCLFSA